MDFDAVLSQILSLLQCAGRVSYGALKRRFNLDDAYLEDLKNELIDAKQCAVDEGGKVLVWTGGPPSVPTSAPASTQHVSSDPASALPYTVPTAERRQLTVMFCDLVDSTSLAEQLDVEDYRDVIQAYQAACVKVIQHFEGYVAQYLGDGLLIYFGYPKAYEDNAQRAIRTGLGIFEAIEALNTRLAQERGVPLAVRVGIHTGLVVIGEVGGVGRQERLALGATPNIASRLQGLAAPDTVVISETTYYLTQGYFTFQDLGRYPLRGVPTPMRLYRVLQVSEVKSRWDVTAMAGLTSLVGREAELQILQQKWVQSQQGVGQVVVLSGEAGIGKSRLVEVLCEQIGPEHYTRITFRCSPYYTHSAFYPIIEYVQRRLQWHRDDTPSEKLDKLEQMLWDSGCPLQEAVPLFAGLLSIPLSDGRYAPLGLSPQRLKQKTQETLVLWLLKQTQTRPVLAVWEDLHWADPSTLEMLGFLLDQMPTARLLAILTCRPEFQPPWDSHPHLNQITLSRLDRPQVEQMMTYLTQGKALPVEVWQQVISKTDGIPLFVEELIKMVLESEIVYEAGDYYALAGPLPPLAIPTT